MLPDDLVVDAHRLLALLRSEGLKVATAESCTGGLIAALLTEVAGSSEVLERGFVTYSNAAKIGSLGVDLALLQHKGAVSAEVAAQMAAGAVRNSAADIAVAVTGIAGPGGGTPAKPVGLVYLATTRRGWASPRVEELRFGDIGRSGIRRATVARALVALTEAALAPRSG